MAAENLRDLSQPIDVSLLDATVAAFYISASILRVLQNNADMGLQVMHILKSTKNLNTKFFALQVHIRILESTQENISNLLLGLEYLINISYVDDTEVFKDCLDSWNSLVSELFEPH
ncbi:protein EXPORTIN 1A [Trifolium repens]|nr:protein EXPORTIN 1A [Trifolium repens]